MFSINVDISIVPIVLPFNFEALRRSHSEPGYREISAGVLEVDSNCNGLLVRIILGGVVTCKPIGASCIRRILIDVPIHPYTRI